MLATPLGGPEILRAKMIGPIWALRSLAYLMLGLWAIGLALGAIHPVGVMFCLVEMVVFTWFLSAIGTFFSLRSRNSTRALALTMATLVFLNVGYLFCLFPLQPNTAGVIAGSTPAIFAVSLVNEENLRVWDRDEGGLVAGCLAGVIVYGIAAAGLTIRLFESFDRAVDRPDRSGGMTPHQRGEMLRGRSKEIVHDDELPGVIASGRARRPVDPGGPTRP